jgi:hypothetical protein
MSESLPATVAGELAGALGLGVGWEVPHGAPPLTLSVAAPDTGPVDERMPEVRGPPAPLSLDDLVIDDTLDDLERLSRYGRSPLPLQRLVHARLIAHICEKRRALHFSAPFEACVSALPPTLPLGSRQQWPILCIFPSQACMPSLLFAPLRARTHLHFFPCIFFNYRSAQVR